MARKQKTEEATPLDEPDRTLYSTFRGAANSLSQLYTQSVHHQALSFHAGERHALDKLYQWILSQHEIGSRLTVADIATHIQQDKYINHGFAFLSICKFSVENLLSMQNEMDFEVKNPSTSPILEFQQQTQSAMQPLFDLSSQASTGCVPRSSDSDQAKNCVFSNALSSPARGSFQHYHLAQGCGVYANGQSTGNGGARNHDPNHNQELNSLRSNESSMDMNLDTPTNQSYC
ncbi:hypothetical protein GW17_00022202 [Ensete ventricosum]|nr:hypothetical protein GW17_00022202 [Ensete ventricosum]RZS20462.1 hypothetical protein BHM03_00052978 [Ensete ventricosum]